MKAAKLHNRRLALHHHWWAWDHPRIRAATKATCLDHLLTVVEEIMTRNQQQGDRPGTWTELAHRVYLRRDNRNPQRWSQSRYLPPPHAMLGLATVLQIEVGKLYPSNQRFVAGITDWLCEGQVSHEEALAYSVYRLGQPGHQDTELSMETVAALGAVLPGEAAGETNWVSMIDSAIFKLGSILAAIDKELDSPSSGHCGREEGC